MPKHVRCDTKACIVSKRHNNSPLLSVLFFIHPLLFPFLTLMLALPPCPSLVRKLSISSTTWRWRVLSGIEAFIRFLFQFVWCLFNAVEMEKCSSYNDNYYCFGIMVTKKQAKKKRNVLLNVVQIALEMLCFFKESTNPSDGPFLSSHRQMGIKMTANHLRCPATKTNKQKTKWWQIFLK